MGLKAKPIENDVTTPVAADPIYRLEQVAVILYCNERVQAGSSKPGRLKQVRSWASGLPRIKTC